MPNNKQKKTPKTPAPKAAKTKAVPKQKAPRPKGSTPARLPRPKMSTLNVLAQTMALPGEHNPIRLPVGDPERTSVLNFTAEKDFFVPASGVRYAMVTRSPVRNLWLSRDPPTAAGAHYMSFTYTGVQPALPNGIGESYSLSEAFAVNRTGSSASAGSSFITSYGPAVDKSDNLWFYSPAGGFNSGIEITTSASLAAGGAWALDYEYVTGWDSTQTINGTIQLGSTAQNLTGYGVPPGWWRPVSLSCTASTATDALIQKLHVGTTTGGFFANPTFGGPYTTYWDMPAGLSEENTVTVPWNDTRATAVATLFMNTTAVLNKEGRVQQFRGNINKVSPFSDSFFLSLFQTYFDSTSKDFRYAGLLEHGAYVFTKPDDSSTQFRDWAATSNSKPIFLDAFDYVDILRFTDHSGSTETNLSAITDYHIEFRNSTSLWTTSVTRLPYEMYRQAAASLSTMHNTYENPMHLKDVVAGVRKALRWSAPIVAPYAKGALTALARGALGLV